MVLQAIVCTRNINPRYALWKANLDTNYPDQNGQTPTQAMFTLYRIGFCSVSEVAPVQCEQDLMFCCGAEIVPKRSQCEQKPYPLCNLQRSLLI